MKKSKILSLILALVLAFPLVMGMVGCANTGDPDDEVQTYTITYYGVEDATFEGSNPTSYKTTDKDITLINPTKDGYTFVGWTGTGISDSPVLTVVIRKGSSGNRVFTANWESDTPSDPPTPDTPPVTPQEYSITYIFIGSFGEVISSSNIENYDEFPKTYTDDFSTAIKIPLPKHINPQYEFVGWTGSGISSNAVERLYIAVGTTGNLTFTAHLDFYSKNY